MSQTKVVKNSPCQCSLRPEEVLSKILNEVSDEENDDIEDIASLASGNYKNCKDRINII